MCIAGIIIIIIITIVITEIMLWSYAPQMPLGLSNKKEDIVLPCDTYGKEQKCLQGFGGDIWWIETIWKT